MRRTPDGWEIEAIRNMLPAPAEPAQLAAKPSSKALPPAA
jgi:hypothetical protein